MRSHLREKNRGWWSTRTAKTLYLISYAGHPSCSTVRIRVGLYCVNLAVIFIYEILKELSYQALWTVKTTAFISYVWYKHKYFEPGASTLQCLVLSRHAVLMYNKCPWLSTMTCLETVKTTFTGKNTFSFSSKAVFSWEGYDNSWVELMNS